MGIYLRSQTTPYILLFIERDGSTYLTSLLTSHPDINAIYERFAVIKQKEGTAEEQLAWAKDLYSPPLINKVKAVGFKTKLVDVLDLSGFTQLLHEKKVRVIQMRRRNRIKAVVSRINARRLYEASGNWNLYKEADRMPPLEIDHAQFAEFLREREQADDELQAYVEQLNLPILCIVYEDLLTNKEQTLNETFEFLRVPIKPVQEKTIKHTSDDLHKVILNFEELRREYSGTPYESMFDEVLV